MDAKRTVIVIGAGISGLAAASKLADSGVRVSMLEARTRIGGRIFTTYDSTGHAVELGAEFIHGMPPEIWLPLQNANVTISEVDGESWCVTDALRPCQFFSQIESILSKMDDSQPDESFLSFLEREFPNRNNDPVMQEAKRRAAGYVSGFNAADPNLVGVHWLVEGMRAEQEIDGERVSRAKGGYETLIELFRQRLAKSDVTVRAGTVVERVQWKAGSVEVSARDAEGSVALNAERVLITLPLAVLQAPVGQAGAVAFVPSLPKEKAGALDKLEMGKVIRVVLRFRQRFWDTISPPSTNESLSGMSFLLSQDEWFPTWWTTMPEKLPIITGWAPFQCAEKLSGQDYGLVVQQSLQTLAKLLGEDAGKLENQLEAAYFHDWQSDPFSRGAYSYGKVGSAGAQRDLGAPIQNTLFFAGEATDITGHNGTVHGAIASGHRAADEILQSFR